MKKYPLYISIIVNLLLIATLAVHWKFIGLKYDLLHTPPLNCRQLGAAYLNSHEDIFVRSESTPEQATAFRQSVFVQDTAEKIEALCNTKIADYTLEKE